MRAGVDQQEDEGGHKLICTGWTILGDSQGSCEDGGREGGGRKRDRKDWQEEKKSTVHSENAVQDSTAECIHILLSYTKRMHNMYV